VEVEENQFLMMITSAKISVATKRTSNLQCPCNWSNQVGTPVQKRCQIRPDKKDNNGKDEDVGDECNQSVLRLL
jgi:hypothetical protein